jgi:hypothetical protein
MMKRTLRVAVGTLLTVALVSGARGDEGYKPVASPEAMRTAARLSLQGANDWLAQRDLMSLAQSGPELELMARLLAVQGNSPDWQKGTSGLEDLAKKLGPACKSKDANKAGAILKSYEEQLATLAKTTPGETVSAANFKASATVKTWMLAVDFAYNEAKVARSPEKMSELARVLAEEANAMQFLWTDTKRRTIAREVRDLALESATAAEGKKTDEAKSLLQKAFQRCEFCHRGNK